MAICGCGLPDHGCQPAVAGGVTYADLWVSLALIWPHRLCLLRVLCVMPLLQAFPFPSTLGEVTLHPLSQACVFIYSSCGKWVFPPLLWSFPPTTAFTSFTTVIAGCVLLLLLEGVFVYSSHGRWVFSPLVWGFPPPPLSKAFPLLVAGRALLLPTSLARLSLFIYSSVRDSPPPSLALRVPHPLCYVSLLFLLLITQFFFFLQVEVGLSRGLC
jgi:hypothetical protein